MGKERAQQIDPSIFDGVDEATLPDELSVTLPWDLIAPPNHAAKLPVTMPIVGVCGKCGAAGNHLEPVLNLDNNYKKVRLISFQGVADIHICPIKCTKCLSIQEDVYGGDSSWLRIHNVVPCTTKLANVVVEITLLNFLVAVEAGNGSFSVVSAATALTAYYKSFERSSSGCCYDRSVSEGSLQKSLGQAIPRMKYLKVAMDEMKNQRAEHCTGCAGQGVEIHTTDGCQKGSLYFRKGGDFTGTGEHFTQGWMMGFKEVVALQQGVYAMYESPKLSYSFNRAYAPHPPVRLYYHLSFQWHFSPLV